MSKRYSRQELLGADLVWLLRLVYAGRVFRWSSRPISLLTEEGQQLQVDGGLDEVDFQESFSLLSYEPDPRSVSLELLFPVSVAELEALGHSLVDAEGELSLIRVGDDEADRMALMRGLVRNPVWGSDDELVSFTVQQPPWLDQGVFPPANCVVNTTTWPYAPTTSLGATYPWVFGVAFKYYEYTTGGYTTMWGITTSRALLVDEADEDDGMGGTVHRMTFLLGYGNCKRMSLYETYDSGFPGYPRPTVVANDYTYYLNLIGVADEIRVRYANDALGQQVFLVDCVDDVRLEGVEGPWWTAVGAYYYPSQGSTYAGTLAREVLSLGNVTIDHQRWETVRPKMDELQVGGAILEQVDPGQWVIDNLLPLLPISLVSGPDGVYPIWWDPDAPAVASIVAGADVVRVSQVTAIRDVTDCYTEIYLDYVKDLKTGVYAERVTASADPTTTSGATGWPTVYQRRRATRQAPRSKGSTSDIIYTQEQAAKVVSWQARAFADPVYSVTYEVGLDWGWLEPGMCVELTDSDMRFDGLRCLVGTIDWGLNTIGITLTFQRQA